MWMFMGEFVSVWLNELRCAKGVGWKCESREDGGCGSCGGDKKMTC